MSQRKAPVDEVLRTLYLKRGLTSVQIARRYRMSVKGVCRHLDRLGITRPRAGLESRYSKHRGAGSLESAGIGV